MNSIIQCLINTKPLREFFNDSSYTKKLKTRSGVASAFADLLEEFNSARTSSYVSPASLKRQVEKRASQFSGYSQHDSQELLLFLLDGIHEDMNHCNRSAHKYVELDKLPFLEQASESWRQYTLRDFSPIIEIFVGQIVSTLTVRSRMLEILVSRLKYLVNLSFSIISTYFDLFSLIFHLFSLI